MRLVTLRLSSRSVRNAGAVGTEQQVAARLLVDRLAGLQGHVDLRAGVVQPHGAGLLEKIAVASAPAPTRLKIVPSRLALETTARALIVPAADRDARDAPARRP